MQAGEDDLVALPDGYLVDASPTSLADGVYPLAVPVDFFFTSTMTNNSAESTGVSPSFSTPGALAITSTWSPPKPLLISDVARKVLAKDRPCKRVNVYEVMVKPAVYVEPEMDIRYCSRLFARFDLVRALVVEQNKVVGTISPNSLVLDGMFALEG